MEAYQLKHNLKVIYVQAGSFPEGIQEAIDTLTAKVADMQNRQLFGISKPENNTGIVYKAAVLEKFEGEGAQTGLETFIIPAGNYIGEVITGYSSRLNEIGCTFQKLLEQPGLDYTTHCFEWYKNDSELLCMVRTVNTPDAVTELPL